MENKFYFDGVTHINVFEDWKDLRAEENAHILDNLVVTLEGSIVGVKTEAVLPFLKEPEIRKIRIGATKRPTKFKIESEDDFYRFLALMVSLEDYY